MIVGITIVKYFIGYIDIDINTLNVIVFFLLIESYPDSKVNGANMGPTWVLSAPDGPHVGPMNLALGVVCQSIRVSKDLCDITDYVIAVLGNN